MSNQQVDSCDPITCSDLPAASIILRLFSSIFQGSLMTFSFIQRIKLLFTHREAGKASSQQLL